MKHAIATLAIAVGLAGITTTAQAGFNFEGSFDVNANFSDPGLVVHTAANVAPDHSLGGNGFTFELDSVGDKVSFDLFDIWTNESHVNHDDEQPKPIRVSYDFTTPSSLEGEVSGETLGLNYFFILQKGKVEWDESETIAFGNGGELLVSLSDEKFNKGLFGLNEGEHYGATVQATFELTHASVPEPRTLGLLGLGLAGIGLIGHQRRNRR